MFKEWQDVCKSFQKEQEPTGCSAQVWAIQLWRTCIVVSYNTLNKRIHAPAVMFRKGRRRYNGETERLFFTEDVTINIDENPGAQPGLHSKIVVQNIIDWLITRGSQYLNLILEFKINGNIRQSKNHPRKRHWWNESPTLNKHLHWVGHFDGLVPLWQVVIERSPYQDAQLVVCKLGLYWLWEL